MQEKKKKLYRKRQMTAQDPKSQVLRHFVTMPEETVMQRGLCIQTVRTCPRQSMTSDARSLCGEPRTHQGAFLIFRNLFYISEADKERGRQAIY